MKAKQKSVFISLGALLATFIVMPFASANDSPSWQVSKPESFSLNTSSDLSTRGPVTIRAVVPRKDPQIEKIIYDQERGLTKGICVRSDDPYDPSHLGHGGIGFLLRGLKLPQSVVDGTDFSLKAITYSGYFSTGTSDYQDMGYVYRTGEKGSINLSGTDLLISGTYIKFNSQQSFFFLKEFTGSFSTENWPGGNYQISGVYNDGCSDVYTSVPVNFTLSNILTPVWKCQSVSTINSNVGLTVSCNSDIALSSTPYHLEEFKNGDWVEIAHGTVNGKALLLKDILLTPGNISLRIRTEDVVGIFYQSLSNEISVVVTPGPYSIKCSAPSGVYTNTFFDISCLATSNISGAIAHLQYLSNGKWTNSADGTWTGTSLNLSNNYFGNPGSSTLRVITDAATGINQAGVSASFTIAITAPTKSKSNFASGVTPPKGKIDKASNAYKLMFNVGKNFAKVSFATDTALSQCSAALKTGIIRANGFPQYLGAQALMIKSYLQSASGWQGCLDGFGH
jgi:hypothetical protein